MAVGLSKNEQRALEQAAKDGAVDVIRDYFGRQDFDVNAKVFKSRCGDKFCFLHWAVGTKNIPLKSIQILLEHPSLDPNIQCTRYGETALHVAVGGLNIRVDIVKALLEHPSLDPNIQCTMNGWTVLKEAVCRNQDDIVRALLGHPSLDPNIQCHDNGWTALHIARRVGFYEVLLRDPRVDITLRNKHRATAFDCLLDRYLGCVEYSAVGDWDAGRRGVSNLFIERESERLQEESKNEKVVLDLLVKARLLEEDVAEGVVKTFLQPQQKILSPSTFAKLRSDAYVRASCKSDVQATMKELQKFIEEHGDPSEFDFPGDAWEPKIYVD